MFFPSTLQVFSCNALYTHYYGKEPLVLQALCTNKSYQCNNMFHVFMFHYAMLVSVCNVVQLLLLLVIHV